ncbi:MAG: hypothetical protein HY606_14450, partial [Planctomycetes bacterium]|nr:hypothetical protein [Planctomycetota bacterium]
GEVDYGKFKGINEIKDLEKYTEESVKRYISLAESIGATANYKFSVSAEIVDEIVRLVSQAARESSNSVVFLGRLILQNQTLFTRMLHDHTASNIEGKLQFEGIPVVMIPLRVTL